MTLLKTLHLLPLNPVYMKKETLISLALIPLSGMAKEAKPQPPNIIFFLVDDMGWQDTSVPFWSQMTHFNQTYETPNMERLAARGMKFTQAYASSVSSPSRCSLLTGMNAARHRVTNWTINKNESTDREDDLLRFPEWNVNGICEESGIERPFKLNAVESEVIDCFQVKYSDIDINQHVNTVHYLDWMVNTFTLDEHRSHTIHRIDMNFMNEVVYGNEIMVFKEEVAPGDFWFEAKANDKTAFRGRIKF